MKPLVSVPLWLSELLTTTFAVPAEPAPVVHVNEVALTTFGLVQTTPPTVTVAPATKPVPATVTGVPPDAVPEVGLILVAVGAVMNIICTEPLRR